MEMSFSTPIEPESPGRRPGRRGRAAAKWDRRGGALVLQSHAHRRPRVLAPGRPVGDPRRRLSEDALRLVGGILTRAQPLTAFGNTVAASCLRLVPGQEAPTNVCWGYRDRSSLVRVPLSFAAGRRLDRTMNPNEDGEYPGAVSRPTIEYRSPDGSAFVNLLLAAATVCAREELISETSARRRPHRTAVCRAYGEDAAGVNR